MSENVPVKETQTTRAGDALTIATKSLSRRKYFENGRIRKPTPDMTKPLGTLYWPLALPALLCSLLAVLVFTHTIELGAIPTNWTIQFNVNIVTALIILLAGALAIVPKLLKNPLEWRNRNTLVSIVVLVLVALYFLSGALPLGPLKGLNLGTFAYTITSLSLNLLALALLAIALVWLAFNGSLISGVVLFVLFLWWGFSIEGFGWSTITSIFTSPTGGSLLATMIPPDWSYFGRVIDPMLITIQTAILATVIGIVGALPLSILAARNTTPHPVIYNFVRLLINIIRSIPSLVLALIFITIIGLGPVPGAFGLGLHTISVLTKLYSEAIESVNTRPVEALSAVGADGLKRFRWGVFPQAFPLLVSSSIYYWESN
ncbi:MAG: phosphate/phosphonate ABC transporter permease, partial [Ktedonobacteraceae bacterium]|nr:phosphate/phosphonate ABC transporter permease [Ktedonobacteraceae bacterium]